MDVHFTESAAKDYAYWKINDPQKCTRIKSLCAAIQKNPHEGIGKPEPLKFDLQGCWSRRIDRTHRLVYTIDSEGILILSCRYHY